METAAEHFPCVHVVCVGVRCQWLGGAVADVPGERL